LRTSYTPGHEGAQAVRKALVVVTVLAVAIVAAGSVMYVRNTAPTVPAVSVAEAANPTRPYVVKLHAQWCPICMMTKAVWSQVEATYSGRANFVVFDFTNQATTNTSRAEATRLGLETFFEKHVGETGTIAVLDGRTKDETASIHGIKGFDEYRAALDTGLGAAAR